MSQPESSGAPREPGQAPARAAAVLDRARAALLDRPSGARDLRLVADATLDLTVAHPSGQAVLLSTGRQALSGLVRDAEARVEALRRLRRFREVVGGLEADGLEAGHLVAGVVVLPGAVEVPVLLRRCRVGGTGDGDVAVHVSGEAVLNPALVRELARRSSGALDLDALVAGRVPRPDARGGVDPYPLLDLVQSHLPAVPGATLRRRLLLAPVTVDPDRVVADLDRLRPLVDDSSPLAWLGEDWDEDGPALAARLGAALEAGPVDPGPGVTAVADLLDRFAPTRPDADQRRVLEAVLAGHSLAVDAPPGTGATTLAVTVAAVATATGRRCLVVVPDPGQADVLRDRLAAGGLAGAPAVHEPPARGDERRTASPDPAPARRSICHLPVARL